MPMATINGITVSMTVAEVIELANSIQAPKQAPVACATTEKMVEQVKKADKAIHATVCGHPITRTGAGRPPKFCEDCSGRKAAPKAQPTQTEKFNRKFRRTATTDPEKVRGQVMRYATFAAEAGLISRQDAGSVLLTAKDADFEQLSKLKKALGGIISDAKAWDRYMAQRKQS